MWNNAPSQVVRPSVKNTRHQNFGYTTTADRVRTVSWKTDCHQIVVVKPGTGCLPSNLPQKLGNQNILKFTESRLTLD